MITSKQLDISSEVRNMTDWTLTLRALNLNILDQLTSTIWQVNCRIWIDLIYHNLPTGIRLNRIYLGILNEKILCVFCQIEIDSLIHYVKCPHILGMVKYYWKQEFEKWME